MIHQTLLSKAHLEELKQLRMNNDVIVCQPDKGTGIVLLDKFESINKMNSLLGDRTKFQK